MDPQVKSILTSVVLGLATSVVGWGVNNGLIPVDSQAAVASAVANDAMTFGALGIAGVIAWYKSRAHTPTAQIAAVNDANNGVKVVAANVLEPEVNVPLKGSK